MKAYIAKVRDESFRGHVSLTGIVYLTHALVALSQEVLVAAAWRRRRWARPSSRTVKLAAHATGWSAATTPPAVRSGDHRRRCDEPVPKPNLTTRSPRTTAARATRYSSTSTSKDYHAGIVPTRFRRAHCTRRGGMRFQIKGNPYWRLVPVYDVGGNGDVTAVSIKGSGTEWDPDVQELGNRQAAGQVILWCVNCLKYIAWLFTFVWQADVTVLIAIGVR